MRTLRSIQSLLILGLLFSSAAVHAQASRTVTRTVELSADGQLALDTFSGRVEVTTWERPQARIEVRFADEDAELVERTQLVIDALPDRVEITEEVETGADGGFLSDLANFFGGDDEDHPSAYYTIRMPRTANLKIDAFSSEIHVADLRADLTVDTFSGDVFVESLRGRLDVETFSGNVTAENVRGSAEMESHSGNAEIAFDRLAGPSAFDTFSGDVTLYLPEDAQFDLAANLGMSGDFDTEFPTDALNVDDDALRLAVGGGGPTLQFETFSGNLTLRTQ